MKRCVVNVAVGSWYPRGQARLVESLHLFDTCVAEVMWRGEFPHGSPTHAQVPYSFKSYAMQAAALAGFTTILWLDASCWAIKNIEPVFSAIEQQGHLFSFEGWTAGQWLKDEALNTLKATRKEALGAPLLGGMFMGVDLTNFRSRAWFESFCALSQDGHTLTGEKMNHGQHSKDPECLGHSGDQAVASVLAHRLGMQLTYPPAWRDWAKHGEAYHSTTYVVAEGL